MTELEIKGKREVAAAIGNLFCTITHKLGLQLKHDSFFKLIKRKLQKFIPCKFPTHP
jgi:hypothetical protein